MNFKKDTRNDKNTTFEDAVGKLIGSFEQYVVCYLWELIENTPFGINHNLFNLFIV